MNGKRSAPLNLASLDLNLMVVLDALLQEQNVTRAGHRIGLSQPAVSNALSRLRHLLDDPLLERDGRQMRLTERAHALRDPLRTSLDQIRQMLEAPRAFDPSQAEFEIRIHASDYTTFVLLPALRRHLRAIAPGAEIQISWRERALVSELLDKDEIDFAIGRYDNLPGSIRRQPLYEDENVVVAHCDHEVLQGPLSIDRLTTYPRIAVSFDGRRYGYTERALALAGGALSSEVILPHALVGPLSVCETDLVVFTSRRVAERLGAYLPIGWRPLPFDLERVCIEVLWHARGLQDPAKAWFLDQLVEVSRNL